MCANLVYYKEESVDSVEFHEFRSHIARRFSKRRKSGVHGLPRRLVSALGKEPRDLKALFRIPILGRFTKGRNHGAFKESRIAGSPDHINQVFGTASIDLRVMGLVMQTGVENGIAELARVVRPQMQDGPSEAE